MVILARRLGITFVEVPVSYRGRVGDSKITGTLKGTLTTGLRMIWLILRYRFGLGPRVANGRKPDVVNT